MASNCDSCSQRNIFKFLYKNTLDSDNSEKCSCVISEKDVIIDFLSLMQSHNMLLDLNLKNTLSEILIQLAKIPRYDIVERLENSEFLSKISQYVVNVVQEIIDVRNIYPWEYLDVGCGSGRVSRTIASSLEVMTQHTDIKDNRIEKYSHYEDFMIFDGVDLPHESNVYSVVTCLTVLHHANNPSGLIKSIYRILKQGGIFIIKEFDCENLKQSYSLNFMHQILSDEISNVLSVGNYRSRKGWREFIVGCGFILLKDKHEKNSVFLGESHSEVSLQNDGICSIRTNPYHTYLDVFQKPIQKEFYNEKE